jgi:DNA-directed RNA polymerase subunit K/omega
MSTWGDGASNKFLVAVVAAQRVRQLSNGARPHLDMDNHKFIWVAVSEVTTGTVSWRVEPEPAVETRAPGTTRR